MTCECANFDEVFFLESAPEGFETKLRQLDMADWKRLYECPVCGALWAVDEWDKYCDQVVSRVTTRENWSKDESEQKRKELLRKSRGGEEVGECIWAGCHKPRIKGVVYCLDHLYATGARK
jgi:hypothetical protein